jgi:hypothetical protein
MDDEEDRMRTACPYRAMICAVVGVVLWIVSPLPGSAAAEPLELRATPAKHTGRELRPDTQVVRLVVKFAEGSKVKLRGGRLAVASDQRTESERDLLARGGLSDAAVRAAAERVEALLQNAPGIGPVRPLFEAAEPTLSASKAAGEKTAGQQLADLNLYFQVPLVPGTTAGRVADLVAALNAQDGVEVAYAEPRPEPAAVGFGTHAAVTLFLAAVDIPPPTPGYEPQQGYLGPAPAGIDARYAWTVTGGKGLNVKVVDVEGGWRTTHEDMPTLFVQTGAQIDDLGWRNHGTAVLGEIVGAANAYGVSGIAYQARAGVSSVEAGFNVANAIYSAGASAGPGGIVLIELHAPGPSDGTACTCNLTQCDYIAVEYWQGAFDAIAHIVANGVVVVEAAGNGSADLDSAAYGRAFDRSLRDSGAIIVGASTARTRVPMCWTNFGSRVDVHAWGESVHSMGYGNLFGSGYGEDQFYTATFSGTSSASPIVTGAAACAQGVALAKGFRLGSRHMRTLLAAHATPQAADARNIGPMPDLRLLLPEVKAPLPAPTKLRVLP